jgi:hypothetical protein
LWSNLLPKEIQERGKASGHAIFDPNKSTTWKASDGQTWEIQYGDGSTASGVVGTDDVRVGGLSISNQSVQLAKTMAPSFESSKCDGLMGLGFVSRESLFMSFVFSLISIHRAPSTQSNLMLSPLLSKT